jgi:hypothetical protein
MAPLLVQAPKPRVKLLETLERAQGIRDPSQVTLAHCHEVQNIPIFRYSFQERLGGRQAGGKLAFLQQAAGAQHFGLNGREERIRFRWGQLLILEPL